MEINNCSTFFKILIQPSMLPVLKILDPVLKWSVCHDLASWLTICHGGQNPLCKEISWKKGNVKET